MLFEILGNSDNFIHFVFKLLRISGNTNREDFEDLAISLAHFRVVSLALSTQPQHLLSLVSILPQSFLSLSSVSPMSLSSLSPPYPFLLLLPRPQVLWTSAPQLG